MTPPWLAEMLLAELSFDAAMREGLLGDLAEESAMLAGQSGAFLARTWYWGQAVRAVPPLAGRALQRMTPRHYLVGAAAVLSGWLGMALLVTGTNALAAMALGRVAVAASRWPLGASSLGMGVLCATLGGAVAALVARGAPLLSSLGAAVLALVVTLVAGGPPADPSWLAIQLLVLPATVAGGALLGRVRGWT
jgi:hypothetical protein